MADRCLECGFDYGTVTPVAAAELLRQFPPKYRALVAGGEELRTRPSPWTWSALEYTCHVRDVFAVYTERTRRVLSEDRPTLPSMQREERVVRDRYNEQDPGTVLDGLGANAEELAALLGAVPSESWARTGLHPTTGERDLQWMAANCVHEGRHHLMDVERVLRAVG